MRRVSLLLFSVAAALAGCSDDSAPQLAGPDERVWVDVGDAPVRGPAGAVVTLVEFADFECPYCGDEEPVLARLLADYPTQLRLVYKQFPLDFHEHAHLAAEASLAAAAQGQFWAFHDLLYAHQGALARSDLDGYAAALGLDLGLFDAALDLGTYAAAVDAEESQGLAIGVNGTPTLFVNGRMGVGAFPYDSLAAVVDEEIALSADAGSR